jgi:hypothetical protein
MSAFLGVRHHILLERRTLDAHQTSDFSRICPPPVPSSHSTSRFVYASCIMGTMSTSINDCYQTSSTSVLFARHFQAGHSPGADWHVVVATFTTVQSFGSRTPSWCVPRKQAIRLRHGGREGGKQSSKPCPSEKLILYREQSPIF